MPAPEWRVPDNMAFSEKGAGERMMPLQLWEMPISLYFYLYAPDLADTQRSRNATKQLGRLLFAAQPVVSVRTQIVPRGSIQYGNSLTSRDL